jgi:hypothetical protein
MADASGLKQIRRPGLGAPPSRQEAKDLSPEPAAAPEPHPPSAALEPPPEPVSRIDGRSLRRSGRTIQFATRVSPDFDVRVRTLAQRDGLLLVEVLEKALEAYENSSR